MGLEPATFALARRVRDVPWCSILFIFNTLANPQPFALFLINPDISRKTSLRIILDVYTGIVAGIVHSGQECVCEALRWRDCCTALLTNTALHSQQMRIGLHLITPFSSSA
jgi:hypothetical protein